MEMIQTTYCKHFDNSCYHHQYIANWTAVIMLQVLIGDSGERRCEKMKNAITLLRMLIQFDIYKPKLCK